MRTANALIALSILAGLVIVAIAVTAINVRLRNAQASGLRLYVRAAEAHRATANLHHPFPESPSATQAPAADGAPSNSLFVVPHFGGASLQHPAPDVPCDPQH